jgi:hypothetical protein
MTIYSKAGNADIAKPLSENLFTKLTKTITLNLHIAVHLPQIFFCIDNNIIYIASRYV